MTMKRTFVGGAGGAEQKALLPPEIQKAT